MLSSIVTKREDRQHCGCPDDFSIALGAPVLPVGAGMDSFEGYLYYEYTYAHLLLLKFFEYTTNWFR